jgi:hypothetical protein
MTGASPVNSQPRAAIPPDDPNRKLTVADPDGAEMRHVSVSATFTRFRCRAPRQRGDIASSICLCPTATVRRRIATISRKCSYCLKASWKLLSVARRKRSTQGRLSTSRQSRRICSSTNLGRRFICSACAHPRDKRSSSWPSASQSAAGCRRRQGRPSLEGPAPGDVAAKIQY